MRGSSHKLLLILATLVPVGLLGAAGTAQASDGCGSSSPELKAERSAVRKGAPVQLSGSACGTSTVTVQVKRARAWKAVAQEPVADEGTFAVCAKATPPSGQKVASFRALAGSARSRVVKVRVKKGGSGGCDTPPSSDGDASSDAWTAPDATPDSGEPNACPLSVPGTSIGPTLSDCQTVGSDTAAGSDPLPFWGSIDCETESRQQWLGSAGDTHATATGAPQGNAAYRRTTALDGDDFYGERCEYGLNDHRYGPTAFYHEGQRRATFLSLRLPDNFPLNQNVWQVVMQMKQAQPSADSGTPVIELDAYNGNWVLLQSDSNGPSSDSRQLWSAPAQKGAWTRFAFDITYSQNPSVGRIKVYADLNGDGDFDDSSEQSQTFETYTLKYEPSSSNPPWQALPPGSSIPSHLRAGLYHSPSYSCPAPSGCSVELDNVQVLKP